MPPLDFLPAAPHTPFDAIRNTRPDGSEFWSARDLMPLLGYSEWRKFDGAIDRACASLENQKMDVTSHVVAADKLVTRPQGGSYTAADYELSRFSCHLVAMNGDPRKPEVAAAQEYFAVQTHRAETLDAALLDSDDELRQFAAIRLMLDSMERNHLAAKRAQAQAQAAQREADQARIAAVEALTNAALANARVDSMENRTGHLSALAYARTHGLPTDEDTLRTLGIRAAKLGRAIGAEPGKAHNARYGDVNTWLEPHWDEAAASLQAEGKL